MEEIIENHRCKLKFSAPYSPDFNPIEYSFSIIKSALRGSYQLSGTESPTEMAEKIMKCANEIVTPTIARNQFRHCKIRVESDLY